MRQGLSHELVLMRGGCDELPDIFVSLLGEYLRPQSLRYDLLPVVAQTATDPLPSVHLLYLCLAHGQGTQATGLVFASWQYS